MGFVYYTRALLSQVNSMKRLVAAKPWQPKIVTINENGGITATSSSSSSSSVAGRPLRYPRKIVFTKEDMAKENGNVTLDNGITVGVLTNNNRTTAMLMTPN